jgi:hypothetical protein
MCTVNTANEIVPMMNASELLYFRKIGGLVPWCVNDDSHCGRGMFDVWLVRLG